MKKYILFLGLGLATCLQSNAQKIMGGPEIGVNFSTMSQWVNDNKIRTEMLLGLKVGAVLDIGATSNFSIQPGLFYSMKGFSNDYTNTIIINNLAYSDHYEQTVRVNYLEIPINFIYKFGNYSDRFFVGGGPYIGVATGGTVETQRTRTLQSNGDATKITETTTHSIDIGNSRVNDDIKPIDAGLNIMGGYEFRSGIFMRANVGLGLANVQPGGDDDNSLRNFCAGLSVGYLFGK